MLVGREVEFTKLETLLLSALSAADNGGGANAVVPLSIYISGPPGTGKTATVQAVVNKLEKARKKFRFISVDCFSTPTPSILMKKLLAELGHNDTPASRANDKLCEVFSSTKRRIVILLDEVDKMLSGRSKFIYTIFGWPTQFNGRVVVIGIANTLDLTQRQMPLLKLTTSPHLITFSAYTGEQLIAILEHRLSSECLDRKAIELCARKVSALTGDVRQALDIASQMIVNLETTDNNEQEQHLVDNDESNKENDEAAAALLLAPSKTVQKTPSKCERTPQKLRKAMARGGGVSEDEVTPKRTKFADGSACREVLKAINKTMSSPCQRSKLPAQTRTLLATLMRLVSSDSAAAAGRPHPTYSGFRTPQKTSRSCSTTSKMMTPSSSKYCSNSSSTMAVSRDRLFSAYLTVCERLKLASPCWDEVDEMLILLESQSMVTLARGAKGGGGGQQTRVCFTIEMDIARAQINDNALINDIEQMDI
uniref:AAA+ ATPase domain-containing protein n=1 Tax=Globodera rostochiensis TaxID=31243 RepID=A0A914IFW5_GLORO